MSEEPTDPVDAREPMEPGDDVDPPAPEVVEHDAGGLELASLIAHSARGRKPARRPRQRTQRASQVSMSGARSDERDPLPLGEALSRVTRERGWTTEISVHLLLGRWEELVGATNAAHSRPEAYENKVLLIRTDSTAWASNLRLLAPQLVARLNEELGQGTVVRVDVKGPDAPSWRHGKRVVRDGRGPRDTYG